jgi:threonine/homoserine/homoserine lactone efflux protein
MSVLATGIAAARRAIGPRAVRAIDAVAGLGLLGFGGGLAYGVLHERS